MEKQLYNISYTGLDKEIRVDCQSYIRRTQDPPGYSPLNIDDLNKMNLDIENDKITIEPGKFVDIGKIDFEEENKRTKIKAKV